MIGSKIVYFALMILLSFRNCKGFIFQDSVLVAPNDAYIITALVQDDKMQLQAQPFPYRLNTFKSMIVDQLNNAMIISEGNKLIQLSAKTQDIKVLVDKGLGSVTTMDMDPTLQNLYWFDDLEKSVGGLSLKTYKPFKMPNDHNIDGAGKMRFLLADGLTNKAFHKVFKNIIEFQGETPGSSQLAYNDETNTLISLSWNGSYLVVDRALARERIFGKMGFATNPIMDFFYCYNYEGVGCCLV